MLDVEEVFITLSPEYLPNNYHELFYCLVNNNSIYEDATNRLAYKNKEYNYENAYVTLLGTNDYLYGVLGLKASLDAVDSRYPLIVLVSDLVSQETLETLYNYDITYKLISDLKRKEIIECVYNGRQVELGTTINKIYCFTLTEYNKILFLDADCIVTKNIDKVFDIETKSDPFFLGGVGLIKHVDGYSSPSFTIEDGTTYNYCYGTTIFLTKPDNKIFNDLKHAYENCNNIVNVTDSILFTNYFEQFKDIIFPKNSLYHNNTSEKY